MTTNEIWTLAIAIYGAVVATMVLGWDVMKWMIAGPRLKVTANAGMVLVGGGADGTERRVLCTVVNRGDMATTLTNLGGMHYGASWHRWIPRMKPDKTFIIAAPSEVQRIPYTLEPGQQWMGLANQDAEIDEMLEHGALYLIVFHSHADKGVFVRVRRNLPPKEPDPAAS